MKFTIPIHFIILIATLATLSGLVIADLVVNKSAVGFDGINWYPVDQWQVDLCSKWGGEGTAATSGGAPLLADQSPITATVQGTRTLLPSREYLYEIAYYAESLRAETPFSIRLAQKNRQEERTILGQARAVPGGIADRITIQDTESYDLVRMYIQGITEPIEVQIERK